MLLSVALPLAAFAAEPLYELSGRVPVEGRISVSLFGATTPFSEFTWADGNGNFSFKKLRPGAYTVGVFVPVLGEARQTIEIGPGTADRRRRVFLDLRLKDSDFVPDALRRHAVSTRQLAIPDKARRDYEDAQKDLAKHEVDSAIARLQRAVEVAPQFAAAWNNLGTIAYQTQKFDRAEEYFRKALEQEPEAYEPLVNLGGVLVTVHRLDEALDYNIRAVLTRGNDALANAQLGQTYFQIGNFDLALKYLERARQLDPSHFSHPQLFLAEIHLRRGERRAASADLEDFLSHHPDWPQAVKMRETIAELRR